MGVHDRRSARRPASSPGPSPDGPLRAWGVVLAGEEAAASPRIEPPQRRSVLQRTTDRLSQVVAPRRIFLIVDSRHRRHLHRSLVTPHDGPVMVRPRGAGTWPSVLLGITYLHERNPGAIVVVCPARTVRSAEDRLVPHLRAICRLAALHAHRMILLGAAADITEGRPGWLLRIPPPPREHREMETSPAVPLLEAKELPSAARAATASGTDEVLSTGIWAFSSGALWDHAWRIDPDLMRRFEELRRVMHAAVFSRSPSDRESGILAAAFEGLPPLDFSGALLRNAPGSIMVVPMQEGCRSDRGPSRARQAGRPVADGPPPSTERSVP